MRDLTSNEKILYKKTLRGLVLSDESGKQIENYDISKEFGKKLYDCFSDEELLEILRAKAKLLNHTPSQREVGNVFRAYIKKRFQRWPYAIKKAGLSKSSGAGGKSYDDIKKDEEEKRCILDEVKREALKRGYIPHPHQLPHLEKSIKKHFKFWGEVVELLDVDFQDSNVKVKNPSPEVRELLEEIRILAYEKLGRAPLKIEVEKEKRDILRRELGSWRNILFQIDLEPVQKRKKFENTYLDHRKRTELGKHSRALKDCKYRVLNLDDKDMEDLKFIARIVEEKGKNIQRNDVPYEVVKRIGKKCGSWGNILYQIDIYLKGESDKCRN